MCRKIWNIKLFSLRVLSGAVPNELLHREGERMYREFTLQTLRMNCVHCTKQSFIDNEPSSSLNQGIFYCTSQHLPSGVVCSGALWGKVWVIYASSPTVAHPSFLCSQPTLPAVSRPPQGDMPTNGKDVFIGNNLKSKWLDFSSSGTLGPPQPPMTKRIEVRSNVFPFQEAIKIDWLERHERVTRPEDCDEKLNRLADPFRLPFAQLAFQKVALYWIFMRQCYRSTVHIAYCGFAISAKISLH